jgi:hypothetical protein
VESPSLAQAEVVVAEDRVMMETISLVHLVVQVVVDRIIQAVLELPLVGLLTITPEKLEMMEEPQQRHMAELVVVELVLLEAMQHPVT